MSKNEKRETAQLFRVFYENMCYKTFNCFHLVALTLPTNLIKQLNINNISDSESQEKR